MTDRKELDQAVFAFYEAKEEEEQARIHRLECERRIIELIGVNDEGTKSEKTELYKISTTQTLKRELMPDAEIPYEILQQITRVKSELDVSALKRLATSNPEAYRIACAGIVTKPNKPSVKLEIIESTEAV